MEKHLAVVLLASLLAGCAHDPPYVPVYGSQGRLVHTSTRMKGTTEDSWDAAGATVDRATMITDPTLDIAALTRQQLRSTNAQSGGIPFGSVTRKTKDPVTQPGPLFTLI